jgi:hypothetical protein
MYTTNINYSILINFTPVERQLFSANYLLNLELKCEHEKIHGFLKFK